MSGEEKLEPYTGILEVEGTAALAWVGGFRAKEDDAGGEAALAIGASRSAEAFDLLKARWERAEISWFRSALLSAVALTRQQAATEFLLGLVRTASLVAQPAAEALLRSVPAEGVLCSLKARAEEEPRLQRLNHQYGHR